MWVDVKGYEKHYQIDQDGTVRSLKNGGVKIITPTIDRHGYKKINLYKEGKRKTYTIHRLVAENFLENPNNLPCVNHKDENTLNNNKDNLEWCTIEYNNNYGDRTKRATQKIRKKIIGVNMTNGNILLFDSSHNAERETNKYFRHGNIIKCCNGKSKHHKGYKWNYIEKGV